MFFFPLVGHRVLARAACSMLSCRAASNGSFTTQPHSLSRWVREGPNLRRGMVPRERSGLSGSLNK